MTTPSAIANATFAPKVPREVTALLAALQFCGADTEALQELSDTEWHSLLRFCELAHLTLPLAQLSLNRVPAWVTQRLQANVSDNALRFLRVQATYREVARALDQAGVEHIVIKGFTQAPDYVPHPHLRVQSDLDLCCPPDQLDRARSALEAIGYRSDTREDYGRADHSPTMIRPGKWTWRGNAFDPEMPLSVELHFCLWNNDTALFPIPETDQFWHRRIARSVAGLDFPALDPIDHLGHLTLHILRNILSRDTIVHHVYELASFLDAHAADDAFWTAWKTTHTDSLRAREAIAFYHARLWFRCDIHPAVREQIDALPPRQTSWLERFGSSALEVMFHEIKDAVWLHMTLLDTPLSKLTLLRRSFLPNRVPSPARPAAPIVVRAAAASNRNKGASSNVVSYFALRTISYARANISTVARGLGWHLSRHASRISSGSS